MNIKVVESDNVVNNISYENAFKNIFGMFRGRRFYKKFLSNKAMNNNLDKVLKLNDIIDFIEFDVEEGLKTYKFNKIIRSKDGKYFSTNDMVPIKNIYYDGEKYSAEDVGVVYNIIFEKSKLLKKSKFTVREFVKNMDSIKVAFSKLENTTPSEVKVNFKKYGINLIGDEYRFYFKKNNYTNVIDFISDKIRKSMLHQIKYSVMKKSAQVSLFKKYIKINLEKKYEQVKNIKDIKDIKKILNVKEFQMVDNLMKMDLKQYESLLSNNCPHIKLHQNGDFDALRKFYGEIKDGIIHCKQCKFILICSHYNVIDNKLEYSEQIDRLQEFLNDDVDGYDHVCKYCYQTLFVSEEMFIQGSTEDSSIDDTKRMMFGVFSQILGLVKTKKVINKKNIVNEMIDVLYGPIIKFEKLKLGDVYINFQTYLYGFMYVLYIMEKNNYKSSISLFGYSKERNYVLTEIFKFMKDKFYNIGSIIKDIKTEIMNAYKIFKSDIMKNVNNVEFEDSNVSIRNFIKSTEYELLLLVNKLESPKLFPTGLKIGEEFKMLTGVGFKDFGTKEITFKIPIWNNPVWETKSGAILKNTFMATFLDSNLFEGRDENKLVSPIEGSYCFTKIRGHEIKPLNFRISVKNEYKPKTIDIKIFDGEDVVYIDKKTSLDSKIDRLLALGQNTTEVIFLRKLGSSENVKMEDYVADPKITYEYSRIATIDRYILYTLSTFTDLIRNLEFSQYIKDTGNNVNKPKITELEKIIGLFEYDLIKIEDKYDTESVIKWQQSKLGDLLSEINKDLPDFVKYIIDKLIELEENRMKYNKAKLTIEKNIEIDQDLIDEIGDKEDILEETDYDGENLENDAHD